MVLDIFLAVIVKIKIGLLKILFVLTVFPLGILGCTQLAGSMTVLTDKPVQRDFQEIYDIPYYEGADYDDSKHRLNLFIPNDVDNPPMMLWIHGGAWAFGDRKDETELARKFTGQGIAVAVVGYRLSPGTWKDPKRTQGIQHPEHIKDVARAFAWIYDKASKYGYDKHAIFVSGYSAGAHLSALLAMDPSYLAKEGRSIRDIKGAIPIAGAYDIEAYYDTHLKYNGKAMAENHVAAVFGSTRKQLVQASPTTYMENQWIPMLVVSETDSYEYTRILERAAKKAAYGNMEFLHVRDKDHSGLFRNLAFSEKSGYRDKIIQYINKNRTGYSYLFRNDVALAYRTFGKGEPLFLLNGGPGFPSNHFLDLARKLADQRTVVLFDQRGTGYSSMISGRTSIDMSSMVDDLEALRKHLGYGQINLMGHSFGGMYAMAYAAKYPDQIKKMVLSHSGGMNLGFAPETNRRLQARLTDAERKALAELTKVKDPDVRYKYRARLLAGGYVFDQELKDQVYRGLAFSTRFYPKVHSMVWRDMQRNRFDLSGKMKRFNKPVLIIQGDNDVIDPKVGRASHAIFPNSKLVILKDCAHFGWLESPEVYFGQILTFLSGHAANAG